MAPNPDIRLGTAADVDTATGTLVAAFLHGPVADWLIPDVDVRRDVYQRCFHLGVQRALLAGQVQLADDSAAVALWFPMTEPVEESGEFEELLAEAAGPWIERFAVKNKTVEEYHPTEPHHYLAFIGVRPDRQGTGLGTALLAHHHDHLDAEGLPAYLEATNPRNRDLYGRLGYTTPGPFDLPDGPPLWPMWREPRTA